MVGSRMLKTVSVLWLLFGVVSLVFAGIELVSAFKMSLMVADFLLPVIWGVIWAVLQFAAGVLGLRCWNRPAKAKVCMVAAVLVVAACVAYNVCMMMYGYSMWPIISIVAEVLISVLYFLGASYNNKLNA